MLEKNKRYNIEFIRRNAIELLIQKNISGQDAEIFVDSMLESDICGVHTHGIRMLTSYIKKIDRNEFGTESAKAVKSTPAFTTVDANNSIGAVSAYMCTKKAIEGAKANGIHTIFARNANTFGPAFYYTEKIAKAGMIGLVCSNSPAAMPAVNGLEAMLGTNPLAFSCPSKTQGAITIDMATSIVAKSRIGVAKIKGETIPLGWALDKDGEPTTDPEEAIKGFILPMAGFKGYGIAMMIDLVSGFLSGAGYLNKVGKFYSQTGDCMNVGQMFVAIDPEQIYEGDFRSDMDTYIATLRRSRSKPGTDIAVPGDDRVKERNIALKEGILLPQETAEQLKELFKKELI